jgi:hypothetical protein
MNFDLGSFIFFHKFFLLSTPSLPPSILKYSVTQKEERLRENMYNVPNQNTRAPYKSTIQFYHTVKYSVTQKEERLRERKILSLSLSFLCVIYLREKSVSIKTQKRFFLVSILIWLKIQSFEYLANFCHKSRRLKLSFKTF